jgi:hypothetical protein
MKRSKWLFNTTLKDCKTNGCDTKLGIVGVFDTEKTHWKYYVVSYYTNSLGDVKTSSDLCGYSGYDLDLNAVQKYGKEYPSLEEGKVFIEEYKTKWETGSNSTLEEKRDKKLSQLLDDEDEKS